MTARVATLAPAVERLDEASLEQLFVEARTHNRWLDRPVDKRL